jgi:nucleotide-binding universal stress UspA family protein
MFRTILVPTDFSACSDAALRLAAKMAASSGARLHVLHAVELSGGLTPETLIQPEGKEERVTVNEFMRGTTEPRMDEQLERAVGTGVPHTCGIAFGKPADAVLRAAKELGADLLVVGTHGRTGLKALVMGSVAEAIVRRAEVPVLTVRQPGEEAHHTPEEDALDDESSG